MSKASVWLDMKSQTSDGTNQITQDKSGHGRDFKLGDGTTSSTFPTFKGPGFDFDGTSDYMLNDNASGIYNNSEQTIVMCFSPEFFADYDSYRYLFDASSGNRYLALKFNNAGSNVIQFQLNGTNIDFVAESVYKPHWKAYGKNVLVVAAKSGDTDAYLNNGRIITNDNSAWTAGNPSEIYLGASNNNTNNFPGKVYHFSTYPFKFSPVQVEQFTNQLIGDE